MPVANTKGFKNNASSGKTHCWNPIRWSVGPTTVSAWMPISQMDEHGESLLWEECFDLFLCLRSYLKQPPFLANPARQCDCRDFKAWIWAVPFWKDPISFIFRQLEFVAANRRLSLEKMQQLRWGLNLAQTGSWPKVAHSLVDTTVAVWSELYRRKKSWSLFEYSSEAQKAQTQTKHWTSIESLAL